MDKCEHYKGLNSDYKSYCNDNDCNADIDTMRSCTYYHKNAQLSFKVIQKDQFKDMWNDIRLKHIKEYFYRYLKHDQVIPEEWVLEYNELIKNKPGA